MRNEVEWKVRIGKLVVDLQLRSSIPVPMDDIDRELISLLCTKIGMLMEDQSSTALMAGGHSDEELRAAVDELAHAATKIAKLAAAAQSIAE